MIIFIYEFKKLIILLKNDVKSLLAGVVAPTVLLVAFFLIFGNFSSLKLAFVNEDNGDYSKGLEASIFSRISALNHKPYFEKIEVDKNKAFELFEEGKVSGIIIINGGFEKALSSGENAHIEYHFNNYNTDAAKNLRLYLDEGILDFYKKTDSNLQIKTEEIFNVEKTIAWFDIIAVSVFLLSFLLGSMFNFLYLFNKEKEYKTLHEYRLSPKNIIASLFARIVVALMAGAITGSINAIFIYILTGINIFVYIPQMILLLICLGLIYIFFASLLAFYIENFSGAAVLSIVFTVVLWFLSGATASVKYASGVLRTISLLIPTTYALDEIRNIVFQNDSMSSGLPGYTVGYTIMIGYMVVMMLVTVTVYVKKLNTQAL